jgi:hypothetical protein
MSSKPAKIPEWLKPWIEAKKRHRLSQMHIQMARELGMNPRKFGSLDNHDQEPWKAPLPIFIENLYFKRFGKERPDKVRSFIEMAGAEEARKRARKLKKQARKAANKSTISSSAAQLPDLSQGAHDEIDPVAPSLVELFDQISNARAGHDRQS